MTGGAAPRRPAAPWVSGVVLAAGRSTRLAGDVPKQLRQLAGERLVRRTAQTALASRLAEVLVVVGHAADAVRAAVAELPVRIVDNPAFADGQSTSVRAGLAAVAPAATAALFLPVDQPLLTAALIDRLLAARSATGAPIVVPCHGDRRGAPVLFGRELFAELEALRGDAGGRQLLQRYAAQVVTVEVEDPWELFDVDDEADLAELTARRAQPQT